MIKELKIPHPQKTNATKSLKNVKLLQKKKLEKGYLLFLELKNALIKKLFFFCKFEVCIHITLTNFILAKIYTPWALFFIFVIFSNMTSQFRKDDLRLNQMKTLDSNN